MTGFRAYLRKERREIFRTWRIWVLPGLLVFFGIASPIVAVLTPKLISLAAGSQPGVVIEIPDPVPLDAYRQFLKNLNQIVLIVVVLTGAGAVSGERSSGTAVLVLTKPVSRTAFVLAKILAQQLLLVASVLVGTVLCAVMTRLVFGATPLVGFVQCVALWAVLALLMVVVTTTLSVLLPTGGAAGIGLGLVFLGALASFWLPGREHTLFALPAAASRILEGEAADLAGPILSAVAAAVLVAAAGAWAFQRQEL